MIAVSVRKDGITVSGHAGYAEAGKDESLTVDQIQYDITPGRADICYGNLSEAGRLLVDSFFIGVCQIADEFPEYVRLA